MSLHSLFYIIQSYIIHLGFFIFYKPLLFVLMTIILPLNFYNMEKWFHFLLFFCEYCAQWKISMCTIGYKKFEIRAECVLGKYGKTKLNIKYQLIPYSQRERMDFIFAKKEKGFVWKLRLLFRKVIQFYQYKCQVHTLLIST